MKQVLLTFCACVLFASISPVASASAVEGGQVSQSTKQGYTYKYKERWAFTKNQWKVAVPQQSSAVVSQPVASTVNTTNDINAFESQVIELTNAERVKLGLQPLQMDAPLMAAAREKSQDMKNNSYFSHTSPTYGSPFDRLKALKIAYRSAGENIAKGQRTPQEVVTAWMNSPGHRANIVSTKFTHIGVGYVQNGHIWTQQFIQK